MALGRDRVGVLALVATALALRLASAWAPARPDEAGYLLVAAQWQRGGEFLYGDLWLDRPPLLPAFFRLAEASGGIVALRVLALVPVAVLVLAAADAGRTVGGARGGLAAAAVTAALQASPLLSGPVVDGELLALPLVMVSVALGLRALSSSGASSQARYVLLVGAGAIGGAAALVKQNFLDGLVLLSVLVVVQLAARRLPAPHALRLLGALAAGACVPVVALLAWAAWAGVGVGELLDPLVSFRSASLRTIVSQSLDAPVRRARDLAEIAVVSGLVPLLAVAAWTGPRRGPTAHLLVATGVLAVVEAASVVLGGSYWTHYLLQLLPAAALVAALAAGRCSGRSRAALRSAVLLLLASGLLSTVSTLPSAYAEGCDSSSGGAAATAAWLRERAEPGDSAVALYGGANVLLDTGLQSAYPYLWSLPVRVLDPDLRRLQAVLTGPAAATWVVQTLPLSSWGLDDDGSLLALLQREYRLERVVCGREIYRRDDAANGDLVVRRTSPR